jgi:hypothetical protein
MASPGVAGDPEQILCCSVTKHRSLGVALGTALDCAVLVGVTLFYEDERRLAGEAERGRAALLGKRVRPKARAEVDLDF